MILRITINVARAGVDASAAGHEAISEIARIRRVRLRLRLALMVSLSGHALSDTGTAFGALGLAERASGANTQKPHTVYRQTRRRVCKPHLPVYTHPTRLELDHRIAARWMPTAPRVFAGDRRERHAAVAGIRYHIRNSISHTVGRSHDRARRDTFTYAYTDRRQRDQLTSLDRSSRMLFGPAGSVVFVRYDDSRHDTLAHAQGWDVAGTQSARSVHIKATHAKPMHS